MKKPLVTLAVSLTVGIGSLFGGYTVKTEASSIQSLNQKKKEIHAQQSNVASDIKNANQQIGKLQNQQDKVAKEIERIGLAIEDTNQKISTKTNQISDTKTEIDKLQVEIGILKERIKKRNEMLKDRARNYQENGGMINYLDVLMGSQSFNDFVDRANAVATIMEADQEILKQHEADKAAVEKNQKKVETDLSNLEGMLSDLKSMNEKMNSQVAEQKKLMSSLKIQEQHVQEGKMALQEQGDLLAAQEAAIQQAIKQAQIQAARAAALERQRREAARKAAEEAKKHGGGGSPSPEPYTPPASSGDFIKPTVGVFTSGFEMRWGEFHYGVDFANPAPNVPVYAAADGVVIKSYLSSSYGNCIFISHYINGQVYTTVYAHMQERLVQSGPVSKGQQIGIMGDTGESTGKHLHFEIHKGPWTADKRNAVNPAAYIPL